MFWIYKRLSESWGVCSSSYGALLRLPNQLLKVGQYRHSILFLLPWQRFEDTLDESALEPPSEMSSWQAA